MAMSATWPGALTAEDFRAAIETYVAVEQDFMGQMLLASRWPGEWRRTRDAPIVARVNDGPVFRTGRPRLREVRGARLSYVVLPREAS